MRLKSSENRITWLRRHKRDETQPDHDAATSSPNISAIIQDTDYVTRNCLSPSKPNAVLEHSAEASMAPPAKRRRRNNAIPSSSSTDDEGAEPPPKSNSRIMDLISSSPAASNDAKPSFFSKAASQPAGSPTRTQPRAVTANFPHNAAPIHLPRQTRGKSGSKSASSSPEKAKKKPLMGEKGKSRDIFSFFKKQAQQAESSGGSTPSNLKPSTQASKSDSFEDLDMISDGDGPVSAQAQSASFVGFTAKKRARGSQTFANDIAGIPNTSQKFLVKTQPPASSAKPEDLRPWAERFAPTNLEELAVHKKKVADVRAWLEEVMSGRMRQRVLVLKGPAGTGKTTTIQLLAEAMQCEVLEWRNPVGSVATSDGLQSMAAQFEEFIGRGGKFGQLDIFSTEEIVYPKPDTKPLDRRKRLILVEEFPNTFTRSSTALHSFRSAILNYLAANTPPLSMPYTNSTSPPVTPVIMIVSETLLTTTSASADSFTAHRLLGSEIQQHPGVGVIEFNAIAPTYLAKALELIVQKESRKTGRRKTPGPLVLKKLGEVGDVRSAVGSLEFLCLRSDTDADWGSRVAFGKTKKPTKDQALTKMEQESLELVTRREASLGIFHAVGKVVYNKRAEKPAVVPASENAELLPSFISLHSRPKRSEVVVDRLIDETGTDTQTFVSTLHENYILSCDAPPTSFDTSTLDHVNGCIDALSDSDLLCPSWDGSFNSTGFGGGTGGRGSGGDILRQDEFSFQIAVRGLLFSLPSPVTRKAPAAQGLRKGKGGDAFKMFYPTGLKLWRMQEEIESTIDLWVTRMMKGENEHLQSVTAGAMAFARPKPGSVENWKITQTSHPSSNHSTEKKEAENAPLLGVGASARKEMLLERLPYMLHIAKGRKSEFSSLAIKDMEKVATFHGIGGPPDDSGDEDGEDTGAAGEDWATDKPGDGGTPRKKKLVVRGRGQSSGLPLQQLQEQKLVLSDDDIEDD